MAGILLIRSHYGRVKGLKTVQESLLSAKYVSPRIPPSFGGLDQLAMVD